jgi:pimeloyl-ACP methyl ester carboxylesterase
MKLRVSRTVGVIAKWIAALAVVPLIVVAPGAAANAPTCSPATGLGRAVALDVRYAQAAGTSFAWADVGAGRPLLLLNGTGSPMAEWDPALLAGLAQDDHRVVVFDYPGLGLSGPAPSRITFSAIADWTADLISVLGLGTPDVLGWSMGGFVAQQLAIRHPDSVGRLVLAGTNAGGPSAVLGPTWVQQADSNSDGSMQSYLITNYPRTNCAQRAGREFVRRLTTAVNSDRYPKESTPARTYNAMVEAEDPWLESSANVRALTDISVPTLVITGNKDVITPPANSRIIARAIRGARLILLPRSGHSFLFQKPALVARTVLDFLDAKS